MSEQPLEEVPHHHILAELETQLHAKTAELVVANARIRARDERIAQLQRGVDYCDENHQHLV